MTCAKANLLLLLAAMIWGVSNVAQKTILDHMGPLTANGLKCLIAVCVIAPFCKAQLREGILNRAFTSGPATNTILYFIAGTTSLQMGYSATTVVNASLLVSTATLLTPAATWLITGTRPAAIVWIAGVMTLFAIRLVGGSGLASFGWGDVMCLLSAVCFAFWFVYLGQFMQEGGGSGAITVVQMLAAGLACVVAGTFFEPLQLQGIIAGLPELAVLGVLSSGIAYLLQAMAQKHTAASVAAVIVSAEAVFGAISGVAILGEVMTLPIFGGIALFFIAVVLVQLPINLRLGTRRADFPAE